MRKNKIAAMAITTVLLVCGGLAFAADKTGSTPDYLHSPLPAGAAQYGAIDGHKMWTSVVEQARDRRALPRQRPSPILGPHCRHFRRHRGCGVAREEIRAGRAERHAHPDRQLSGAAMGPQILARDGDRRRQDRGAHFGAAHLWQPRHRRQGPQPGSRVCRPWQRSGFRAPGCAWACGALDQIHSQPPDRAAGYPQARRGAWRGRDLLHRSARQEPDLADLPRLYPCPDLSSGHRGCRGHSRPDRQRDRH